MSSLSPTMTYTTRAIRTATPEDVALLVAMGEHFLSVVYAGLIAPNAEALTALAFRLIAGPDSTVLVAERNGAVVGMLGLMRYTHPMSAEVIATEVMWWVNPDARGDGLRLLHQGERWAREHGAAVLQMIAPTPEVKRLYDRLGFVEVETTYQRRLS